MKCIYQIVNNVNGKRYIGSANDFHRRKNRHLQKLRKNEHANYHLQKSWNKYGESNFVFVILEYVECSEDLIIREQWWLDTVNPEYNICRVAGSSLGVKRSEATKEKIRQANIGLKHPDWRNQLKSKAQGGENHWTQNKDFTEETRLKMSKSKKELYKNGYIHPNIKSVNQLTKTGVFVKTWPSVTKASQELSICDKGISCCALGKIKSSGGFIWKY